MFLVKNLKASFKLSARVEERSSEVWEPGRGDFRAMESDFGVSSLNTNPLNQTQNPKTLKP